MCRMMFFDGFLHISHTIRLFTFIAEVIISWYAHRNATQWHNLWHHKQLGSSSAVFSIIKFDDRGHFKDYHVSVILSTDKTTSDTYQWCWENICRWGFYLFACNKTKKNWVLASSVYKCSFSLLTNTRAKQIFPLCALFHCIPKSQNTKKKEVLIKEKLLGKPC